MRLENFGRGFSWLDIAIVDFINNQLNYIRATEKGKVLRYLTLKKFFLKIYYSNKSQLEKLIQKLPNDYANYLRRLIDN